jgi:N-acetylglucosamine kinase-like BadF-type ATPase
LARWLLGIDGGGTCTRAALAPLEGGDPVYGEAGPSNWTTLPPEACLATIDAAFAQLRPVMKPGGVAALCLCSAGYYAPHHEQLVRQALQQRWPGARLRLETDLVGAWAGALAAQPGIVLIAGTGSVAYGRLADGREARAGGWGPLFDDEGSGYWLACRGLQAVAKSLDGRGLETELGAAFRALRPELGDEPAAWLRALLARRPGRDEVGDLARAVSAAAEQGDRVAAALLRSTAHELASLVGAVAAQLNRPSPLAWSWSGGLLRRVPRVREEVQRFVSSWGWGPELVEPQLAPEDGALLLAEAALGREGLAARLRARLQP